MFDYYNWFCGVIGYHFGLVLNGGEGKLSFLKFVPTAGCRGYGFCKPRGCEEVDGRKSNENYGRRHHDIEGVVVFQKDLQ